MSVQIKTANANVAADRQPDFCPICHTGIMPQALYSGPAGNTYDGDLVIIYRCPNFECAETFIAYFTYAVNEYVFVSTRPKQWREIRFNEVVKSISPNFCIIYNEANKAEQMGLKQICGCGYRKSLEFLIKDYLKTTNPKAKEDIEKIMLGACINKYIDDPRIKQVAQRATWLGNDETHYQRRWIDKDLGDLKSLIGLVLHWIEAEHLTQEALKSMPEGGKP